MRKHGLFDRGTTKRDFIYKKWKTKLCYWCRSRQKKKGELHVPILTCMSRYNTAGLVGINASGVLHQRYLLATRRKRKNVESWDKERKN
ncbi:hypothetical protein MK805_04510 [Shimazuella sp. AN120528]|uniref:hypothetical protein n=1 Tax=Shimazuella soli TaxID=1892854 RepID=UPI001F10B225|nr:hypothetical protein [Shimazuella soli]MCH5584229.1 hypothetical protein [Shimazuella soli]